MKPEGNYMEKNRQYRAFAFFRVEVMLPVLVFVVALGVRSLPWEHVFSSGKVYLYDPDCYIRLRKILIYLGSFPATFVYDYYQGFPKGTGVISSPAMEYIVAAFAYPFHNLSGFNPFLEKSVALAPPMLGAATVTALYLFMVGRFGRIPAFFAALVLALFPHHVEATVLGRFDNEMLEPLLLLLTFWLYIRTYDNESAVGSWTATGILSSLYLMVWRGALFPLSLLGIDILLRMYFHRTEINRVRKIGKGASLMHLTTAGTLALICVTDIWGTRGLFTYNIISWFHAALFASAALLLLLLSFLSAGDGMRSRRRTILVICAVMVSVAVMVALFGGNIGKGLKVIGGGNSWIDSISQYQGVTGIGNLLLYYGGVSIVAPFALFLLRSPLFQQLPWRRFLVLWTLVMIGASLARTRYAEYVVLNVAILAGIAIRYCSAHLNGKRFPVGRGFSVAVGVLMLALQIPTYPYFINLCRTGGTFSLKGDIEDTMLWLRDNTPSPGDPYHPSVKPAYGVMARWDYGGWLESIALRPSVATNYGTETYGMEEVARFLLAADEEDLQTVLERNKVRYIVVDKIIGDLPMYAKLIGNKNEYFVPRLNPQSGIIEYNPLKEVFTLVSSRLFFADGSLAKAGEILFQPVESVRLVYESPSAATITGFPWEIKRLKVFEYAKGATLTVKGTPGKTAALSQPIETNQGRRFTYRIEKVFGKDGKVDFKLLYPKKTSFQMTGAIAAPLITIDGEKRLIDISDADITGSRQLTF